MNNKFDELAKGLAQSATRRQALKKFGVSLAGMALACFRLANTAEARLKPYCSKAGEGCGQANRGRWRPESDESDKAVAPQGGESGKGLFVYAHRALAADAQEAPALS
jgi:hypothetical protein